MIKLLIINSSVERCGVYQFCYQVYRCLKGLPFEIHHCKIDNERNLFESLDYHQPTHVMFNWHRGILVSRYLGEGTLNLIRLRGIKIWLMPHDEEIVYDRNLIDHVFWLDPDRECKDGETALGRPVIIPTKLDFGLNKKLVIGTSGFCFRHKKFERIKEIAAGLSCHFRFHFPVCDYGRDIAYENYIRDLFDNSENTLEITQDFKTQDELTFFLSQNTINIFPYDESSENTNRGVSSITDNALSSKRPFMISNSIQFRHFNKIDNIINYNKTDIIDCIHSSEPYLQEYREKWSPEHMQKQVLSATNQI